MWAHFSSRKSSHVWRKTMRVSFLERRSLTKQNKIETRWGEVAKGLKAIAAIFTLVPHLRGGGRNVGDERVGCRGRGEPRVVNSGRGRGCVRCCTNFVDGPF